MKSANPIEDGLGRLSDALEAFGAFARVVADGVHHKVDGADCSEVMQFFAGCIEAEFNALNQRLRSEVLPVYRDFQSAGEAMRGSVKA